VYSVGRPIECSGDMTASAWEGSEDAGSGIFVTDSRNCLQCYMRRCQWRHCVSRNHAILIIIIIIIIIIFI